MCPPLAGSTKGERSLDQRVRAGFALSNLLQITQRRFGNTDQRLSRQECLVPGKQDVVAGGEPAEHVILDDIIRPFPARRFSGASARR